MQVVADLSPANVGGVWSLRCACVGAPTRSTAMQTRLTTAAERRRRGFEELDLLMRSPPPIRLRSHRSVYPNGRGRRRATVAVHWLRSWPAGRAGRDARGSQGTAGENAVKGGDPVPC